MGTGCDHGTRKAVIATISSNARIVHAFHIRKKETKQEVHDDLNGNVFVSNLPTT